MGDFVSDQGAIPFSLKKAKGPATKALNKVNVEFLVKVF